VLWHLPLVTVVASEYHGTLCCLRMPLWQFDGVLFCSDLRSSLWRVYT